MRVTRPRTRSKTQLESCTALYQPFVSYTFFSLRWLNTVSLEMLYPFTVHINTFIMTRHAANKLFKKCEDKLKKMPRRSQQKRILFSSPLTYHVLYPSCSRDLLARSTVEHAYIGSNVRALVLLTFTGNINYSYKYLKIYSSKFNEIWQNFALHSMKASK